MSSNVLSLGVEQLENKKLLSTTSNDPNIINQWGLSNISTMQAWDYTTGSKDVVVAIIDSGIDLTHKDLINNIWRNPGEIDGDGIDNEGNGYVDDVNGWNFANNNNDVQDRYGHGTHIAGIIGAEGNNYLGVAGINWKVSIMPLKFMDDNGVGWTGGAANAMNYISMMKKNYNINIVVANASWGGGTAFSNTLYNAVTRLNEAGVVLTVAAGNNGSNNDTTLRYPSCFDSDNIISVAALSKYDSNNLVGFSNYGSTTVDIAAPGSTIYSTMPYNHYGYMSGTSMAAPQVAGVVALLNAVKPGITISEVKNAIFLSADKIPELFGKVATGGSLNAAAAVCDVLNIPYDSNKLPMGAITGQTLTTVFGWARDPNNLGSSVNVKLLIDGIEKDIGTTLVDGAFSFNLGGLLIGGHAVEIKAQDIKSGSWNTIGTTTVNIRAPIGEVGYLSLRRISGWAFSERSGASPVSVKVSINNKIVAGQIARLYRSALTSVVGSPYHGFNISLSRSWFRKGANEVVIQVSDPVTGQLSVIWKGTIRK